MKRIIKPILSFLVLTFLAGCSTNILHEPSGVYKNIDVRLANDTIKSLQRLKGEARSDLIKQITNSPQDYAPPVLYLLASTLFEESRKDDAMFWFYAAQLRGRIDAAICADESAGSAIGVLNEKFGPRINEYAFKDIPKLKKTVEEVLEWEEKTECNYDRRWINLHGMQAFSGETDSKLSAPQAEWEAIRKKTRDEYRSSFYYVLKMMDEKKL